jgi:virulence-associated protein VagC
MKTAEIHNTPHGQTVVLPEEYRFSTSTVTVQRAGQALILAPVPASAWPEGFFGRIHIDDPSFSRPDQGELPPAPVL